MASFFSMSRYNRILSLHWTIRYCLLLGCSSGFATTWYLCVYQRLALYHRNYVIQHREVKKQIRMVPVIKKRITRLLKQKDRVHKEYQQMCTQLDTQCCTRLLELTYAMQQHGMHIRIARDGTQNIYDHDQEMGHTFTFVGTVQQIHYFFKTILQDTLCICSRAMLTKCDTTCFECTCFLKNCYLDRSDKKALQLKKAEGLGG